MENKVPTRYLICLSLVVHVFGLLQYGYSMAVLNSTGYLVRSFINETFVAEYGYSLTVDQVELLYSFANNGWDLGGIIGCLIYAPIADRFGRRYTIFFVPSLSTITSVMLFAVSFGKNLVEPLLVGRIVSGIGAAVVCIGAPVYLNEACPVNQRGIINGWHTVATQTWQLVAVGLGTATALGTSARWIWLMCWPAIPAVVFMFIPFPETPPYVYVEEKDPAKPKTVRWLIKLHGNNTNVPQTIFEYERIKSLYTTQIGMKQIWKNRVIRKTFLVSQVLAIAAAVTGQTLLDHFSTSMFVTAGVTIAMSQYFSLIPIALNIVFGLIVPLAVDRFGRRPLLLMSIFMQFIGISIYITCASLVNLIGSWMSYMAIFGVCGASMGFAIGLGPVKHLSISEIVPLRARATTIKYSYAAAYLAAFVEGFVFPIANESIGALSLIPLATVPQIATFIVIYFKLPETKHRTTMQVYDELADISETSMLLSEKA